MSVSLSPFSASVLTLVFSSFWFFNWFSQLQQWFTIILFPIIQHRHKQCHNAGSIYFSVSISTTTEWPNLNILRKALFTPADDMAIPPPFFLLTLFVLFFLLGEQIGIWYSNNTLAMNSTSLDLNASETLANKTLIVTTILVRKNRYKCYWLAFVLLWTNYYTMSPFLSKENPYVMRKSNYQDYQGNDQYEGFCVDMLQELADILKFSFKIKLVDDGLYGAPEPNGSWTGMVGELINRVSGGGRWQVVNTLINNTAKPKSHLSEKIRGACLCLPLLDCRHQKRPKTSSRSKIGTLPPQKMSWLYKDVLSFLKHFQV